MNTIIVSVNGLYLTQVVSDPKPGEFAIDGQSIIIGGRFDGRECNDLVVTKEDKGEYFLYTETVRGKGKMNRRNFPG